MSIPKMARYTFGVKDYHKHISIEQSSQAMEENLFKVKCCLFWTGLSTQTSSPAAA